MKREAITLFRKKPDERASDADILGTFPPAFGGTESMTEPAGTTPPPDAAVRRSAAPIVTYSVEQLPSFDAAFYNGARSEVSKVAELTVPPREAKAFEVSAGHSLGS